MQKVKFYVGILCAGLLYPVTSMQQAFSEYNVSPRESEFQVPPRLRPRVDFWKDIFTRYGRYQIVVHHRAFPQAVFDVIDLTDEGATLSSSEYAAVRSQIEAERITRIKQALRNLADREAPQNALEQRIFIEMREVPGGREKYLRAINDDLIRTQTGIKEKFAESIRRSGRYLPLMEDIFRRKGLPIELTRIPFIESSFDYTAYSSVGAAGIWQFMPGTAKKYMTVSSIIDERRDPIQATRAAAQYLEYAYQELGSWGLAITSYNHGVAGVARKAQELGTSSIVDLVEHPEKRLLGFASSNFYPEFLAATEVYNNRQYYFPQLQLEPSLQVRERMLPTSLSAQEVGRRFGVSVDALREVNYAVSSRVWEGRGKIPAGYLLKVPLGARMISEDDIPAPQVSTVHTSTLTHIVRKGDTLHNLAIRYRVAVPDLRKMNGIPQGEPRVGQKLIVRSKEVVEEQKPKEVKQRVTSIIKKTYVVRKGESLESIAKKAGVSVQKLKELNHLTSSKVRVGHTLIIGLIEQDTIKGSTSKPTSRGATQRKSEPQKSVKKSKASTVATQKKGASKSSSNATSKKGKKGKK